MKNEKKKMKEQIWKKKIILLPFPARKGRQLFFFNYYFHVLVIVIFFLHILPPLSSKDSIRFQKRKNPQRYKRNVSRRRHLGTIRYAFPEIIFGIKIGQYDDSDSDEWIGWLAKGPEVWSDPGPPKKPSSI